MSKLGSGASEFISACYDNVRALAGEIDERTTRPTFLHGDAELENLGIRDGRLVAIDWEELTGMGPAEVEVVRFALGTCWFQADLTPGDVYEPYERHSTVGLDERLLELSMRILVPSMAIGCLGAMGRLSAGELRERIKAQFFGMSAEFDRSFR